VLWAHRSKEADRPSLPGQEHLSSRRELEVVRIAAALILVIHPIGGLRDPAGLHGLGQYLSSLGFPFGVPLIWTVMVVQIACCVALLARRLVVPACLGHICVLATGVRLFHAPYWFVVGPTNVVGPGKEGMEYSTLLMACFFSLLLAYWPQQFTDTAPRRGSENGNSAAMPSQQSPEQSLKKLPRRNNALLAIAVCGLLAGTLDLLQACLLFGWDIPLSIASGLLGSKADHGGADTYLLGVLLHFFIACTAAATYYYAANRRLAFLKFHPLVCGLFFGAAVEMVMRLIVLPLSALHARGPYELHDLLQGLLIHMAVIGLPISFSVRRFAH
jgi:uncharacterized membrane protein YphA (DoxX/SURF4 family)